MRTRLAVALAVLALVALATVPGHAAPRFGIEGGVLGSKADLSLPLYEPSYRATWAAGLTCEVPVAPRVSVVPGLRYVEYAEQFHVDLMSDQTSVRFDRRLQWHYVAFPVLARVRPFAARGPYLAAGVEAAALLSVRHEDALTTVPGIFRAATARPARPASQIFEQVGTIDADPARAYSSGNFALAGGAGWEFPAGRHAARIEGRYTHGLVDIAKSSVIERHTRAFELLLGLSW